MEQDQRVKAREQEEVWEEVVDEAEWAAIGREQAPEEFAYALIASCPYNIK